MTTFGHNITAGKKWVAIAGILSFTDTFVQGGSAVLRKKFTSNKPTMANPQINQKILNNSLTQ